jgi:primosomal protein N' (replication factor Y) (superfamily II helicase)
VPVIARIEPLTPARSLRGPFDYRVPDHMADVDVGSVLVVPFGRRRALGVVVDTAAESEVPPDRLVEPLAALERDLPPELLRLGLWVGEEYCSTPARGLALVLPPGTGTGGAPRVRARSRLLATLTEQGYDSVAGGPRVGPRQRAALEALASGAMEAATLVAATGCGHAGLRGLERRGLIELTRTEVRRRPTVRSVGARAPRGTRLTGAQAAALAAVAARMDAPEATDRRLLLHGATGSGKTEVYLHAVAAALERGRGAIVLVPEIALTPQTAGRFAERFGETVAVLHSKLSEGERHDEWLRLRRREARVCVGPRSAVFAPVEALGLIVIDEEHDSSYKQEGDPRYDARRVAERRARDAGAVMLAGTATPRPETWRRLRRLSMPERVDGRGMPVVEVLSMAGARGVLHPRTRAALDEVRESGGKAIVLLNRRGWSNFLTCRGCGRVWACRQCDVSLVLHRAAGRLACHHCGHSEAVPRRCPDCPSVSLARHGTGTERLEAELSEALHPLPVHRLDADARAVDEVLSAFDAAPSGVLLGTQMVAKGHDFPDVTLGVVIDADATLRFPDLRAEERTFALVAQLAGRSGRGRAAGRVLVQALDDRAPALEHAARHDAAGFVMGELERREALGYPPFCSLIRVVCSSRESGPEARAAEAIRSALGARAGEGTTVLGPAPLFRRKGRERSQLLVKGSDRSGAIRAVRASVDGVSADRAHRAVAFSVDVDPQ